MLINIRPLRCAIMPHRQTSRLAQPHTRQCDLAHPALRTDTFLHNEEVCKVVQAHHNLNSSGAARDRVEGPVGWARVPLAWLGGTTGMALAGCGVTTGLPHQPGALTDACKRARGHSVQTHSCQ